MKVGGKGKLRGNNYGGGLDKNPQNINRNGRPKIKTFKEILTDLAEKEFTITVPMKACKIVTEENGEQFVKITLPSNDAIGLSLQKNALKDVRWFQELAKIRGEYAPTQTEDVSKIKEITVKIIKPKEND
jgi:hypothetical protein